MAIPDLDFELDFEDDEDPIGQNFWADGIFYVYDYAQGDFVPADPQPDPPEAFVLTPEGLIVPA